MPFFLHYNVVNSQMDMEITDSQLVSIVDIVRAHERLKGVAKFTPYHKNENLSRKYEANIYLKREDLQVVRSYKIRGAYNSMVNLSKEEKNAGIVCASAGNHAQGVALSCFILKVKGTIFMPSTTTKQKISKVRQFGGEFVNIELYGDTFDDSFHKAKEYQKSHNIRFIHPFNHRDIIAGQGTVGLEILEAAQEEIDFIFAPIGGGGLMSGVGSYVKQIKPNIKLIGVEPLGAPAMDIALRKGKPIQLDMINGFTDGAAVKKVGEVNFPIIQKVIDQMQLIPEGKICSTILQLYNEDAIVVEPAGALSIAALDFNKEIIKGKTVCCIISGGNNDITRTAEIEERSLLYEGLKHYFLVKLPQRPESLKDFFNSVITENESICHIEYKKKNNRQDGPVVIGIELTEKKYFEPLKKRLFENNIEFTWLNDQEDLFQYLV